MPRKYIRRLLPSHESVRNNRHMARFAPFLSHPNLWHLNRHSVAGGVAIGMFSGLVPGPLQMITAAALAVPCRVNLPVALATTLYTNPFTIGPLYLVAYTIGALIIPGESGPVPPHPDIDFVHLGKWIEAFASWLLSLGKPLAAGLLALALGLAVIGYFTVQCAWRLSVKRAWRRRAQARRRIHSAVGGTDAS